MPQVTLDYSTSTGWFGSTCGSESGFHDWYAYGCAVDLTKGRDLYFTDASNEIPIGAVITQIDWKFSSYTSGSGSHTPGHISVQLEGYDDTGYFAMSTTDTTYTRTVYPGTVWDGDDLRIVYTYKNKDSLNAVTHKFSQWLDSVVVTYELPTRNLFFGSTF